MHFAASALALAATAAVANAAGVTFWTLDDKTRTIYFTANEGSGSAAIQPVTVSNAKKTRVEFPDTWVGNYYAVQDGAENKPGMLGEINFGSWGGLTYFDVSAIVDPKDHDNVKQIWPASSQAPMSGCDIFPCNNAYYLPDDIQTKTTKENELISTLGSGSTGLNFAQ
ncbi:hypothetical protein JDV02_005088 [Purpureocillium takamizusanense]|uniref:DNase1 protein n=1 Tax=Purpureocillium takamizusanense TaxID=2060973 RepID=A0A9Q8VBF6_9HYPO|nr:uncharacterized protein JDV02_005088 [Purpureocillium takamizusanense]UNI18844.1 hypothetical protein JDV02_005088 [Purpureocillium takamizusanense]